jgi:hypothetical protein
LENHVKHVVMTGVNSVVGLWRDRENDTAREEESAYVVDIEAYNVEEEDSEPSRQWSEKISITVAVLLGLGWIGAVGFDRFTALGSAPFTLSFVIDAIVAASAPLALILVGWIILQRSSGPEQRRFSNMVEMLRREEQRLGATLGSVSERLNINRLEMSEQNNALSRIGEGTSERIKATTEIIQAEIETIARNMQALKSSAAAARGDLAILLANLPKAQIQTRQMVAALQTAGLTAHEQAGALDAQLAVLITRGREADEIAGNAAQKLAAHLSRMEGVSEVAGARLEQAAGQMTGAVDQALERAAEALLTARQGMEAQGAAMIAMVEQNQAAMAKTGAESTDAIAERISRIAAQVDQIAKTFAAQDEASERLIVRLNNDLSAVESRFSEFDTRGIERTERLGSAIGALRNHTDDLTAALASGGDTANSLVDRVGSLMTALDAASTEIDQTLPAAYARLEEKARLSMAAVSEATPIVAEITSTAITALDKLGEANAIVARQRHDLESMAHLSSEQLAKSKETAEALSASIASATADAERLATQAGPQLVESLLSVRETAAKATAHVRSAFAEIIPESAKSLGDMSKEALSTALTEQVEAQMASIAETTANAVSSAQKATDRLMRQMLTISETSAALEARIADAKEEVESADHANFARRVALLVESLNSTAIDVTKILSNEVTDTAWASYLRGDRGIFTRRAVKLLDTAEAREIARHYDAEPEFRDQVNRYIHDFEAMLRNVLATRDGTPLSVTLLSSDTGKLYVALAQAIERLRN